MFRLSLFLVLVLYAVPAVAKVNVVTTTTDLAAVAKAVGGDRVVVSCLSSASEDPHYVDPRPDKIVALNKADLLVAIGLGLETGWLPPLQTQARNPKINVGGANYFEAASVVKLIEQSTDADRSKGDVHPGGNPHFMFDPRAAVAVANAIRDRLSTIDGEGSDSYAKNAKSLNADILSVAKAEAIKFRRLPESSRNVVSYHKSLGYFHAWLGLKEVATIEPKPGVPPNPKHVARVLSTMKKTGAKVVLQESFYPQKTAKTLAQLAKARVVVLPGGTNFPEQSYVDHLRVISKEVYDAIKK